jgi:hypothetical protein
MITQALLHQLHSSPVNTWPWRGWQMRRGSCGLKEEWSHM